MQYDISGAWAFEKVYEGNQMQLFQNPMPVKRKSRFENKAAV